MILNLEDSVAENVLYSDSGAKIEPGDIYFEGEIHGRRGLFLAFEVEKMIGLRDFSTEQRRKLAAKGYAMKNGSFPIVSCQDASNAIRSIGRGGSSKSAIVSHIRKRVRALGCS